MLYKNEDELLKQIKNGNAKAFTILYNHYHPQLLTEAFYKIGNQQEAEDIVQEIFASFWQRRHELSITVSLKHYLLRAVHLQYAHKCRRNRVARSFITYTYHTSRGNMAPHILECKELGQQIKSAINGITAPACRKVFELLYLEEKSYKEIAMDLHIRPQVAKNQASRALKVIRTRLREVV